MARTPKASPTQKRKVHKVMSEFKEGGLKSGPGGKGGKVKSRKQAIAIAMSEAGLARPKRKKGRRKKKKGNPHMAKKRKRYDGNYGGGHMDRGVSYYNAPQGYRSDAGKPMGMYGRPPQGYIDQTGMPNAGQSMRLIKALNYMRNYYGGGGGFGGSTNIGTSPNEADMDRTYRRGDYR